jgi:hypothetical protein
MKGTIRILGLILYSVAIIAMLATTADAIILTGAAAKCDQKKSAAAGALFAATMKCLHKDIMDANSSFDLAACEAMALTKCIAAFTKADELYGVACLNSGSGPTSCGDTQLSAEEIYQGF